MDNNVQNRGGGAEQELDLVDLVKRLWEKRMFIIKVTCIFLVLGILVALFSPKEYTASCVVVPETKSATFSTSSLSGLAAMAGINLGAATGGEMLSPLLYDKLMKNINLRKELIHTPINLKGHEEPVSILDYYTNPDYAQTTVLGVVKKYTIGLPFVILGAIKGKDTTEAVTGPVGSGEQLSAYTRQELNCIKLFAPRFSVFADKKSGDVTISATMPEPLAAAQVVDKITKLLQKYVIELKLQKAEVNYEYIKERYEEAKIIFEEKQTKYAEFLDANKTITAARVKAKEAQIGNEYQMAKDLFTQLTTQLLQAEMKIKEDIPILTVVEPVQVPLEKSAPKRLRIIIMWIFFGGVIACGTVLLADWLKALGVNNKLIEKINS